MRLCSADVGLCKGGYNFSKVVRKFTGSPITHVFLVYLRKGIPWVIHSDENADFRGVQMLPLATFAKTYVGSFTIVRHPALVDRCISVGRIIKAALAQVGSLYNKKVVFLRAVQTLLAKIGKDHLLENAVRNVAHRAENACTELVERCIRTVGLTFNELVPMPRTVAERVPWVLVC